MQAIEAYFLTFPPETLLWGIGLLMFVTCLGVIPNNTDITVMAAAFLSSGGHVSLWQVLVVCIAGYFFGEGVMFFLGKTLGHKIHNFRMVKKILSEQRKQHLLVRIRLKPLLFFIGVRITPILRPWLILSLGSLKLSTRLFLRYYFSITVVYTVVLGLLSYNFARLIDFYLQEYKLWFVLSFAVAWMLLVRYFMHSKVGSVVTEE